MILNWCPTATPRMTGVRMTPAASAEHPAARLIRVKGLSVYTQVHGQGEPLLLHSGVWTGAQSWDPLLPYLTGYRVITFDPPGIGRSPSPVFPLTMRALAAVGAAVLDELGIGSAHVLGLSFGGAVAQQMALSHPARVRRLVLASTVFGTPSVPGDAQALWHFLQSGSYGRERLEQVAGTMFGGRLRTEPALIHALRIRRPPDTQAALYRLASLFGWSSLPWLWAIRQPALILCGDDDPITPLVNHQIMAALLPHARLETVTGGGHLMLLDSPGRVAPVVTRFLGSRLGRRGEPRARDAALLQLIPHSPEVDRGHLAHEVGVRGG
jgi:poly(3-hydroxyoctanoate) depolymerase